MEVSVAQTSASPTDGGGYALPPNTRLQKEFSNDIGSAVAALRTIFVDSSSSHADLTQLFRVATHEANKSRAQNRIFRVILLYCRSSTPPQFQLPTPTKIFTLDVMYLHDKPGPDNCPQTVYDVGICPKTSH